MTTVTWSQDGAGNYEVSSVDHLKQVMNKGALHTDAGTAPSSYWDSSTSYIQTADIDLLGDSTNIQPIGLSKDTFDGSYDGSNYKISNWAYVDPEFTTSNSCQAKVGLFGRTESSTTVKNITLTGICTLQGCAQDAGFIGGLFEGQGMNIECDLEPGSKIEHGEGHDSESTCGGMFGYVHTCTLTGCTLKGTVDFVHSEPGLLHNGGVAGRLLNYTSKVTLIQNLATFPSPISANNAGGIAGHVIGNLSTAINAMTGDITSSQYAGGICGRASISTSKNLTTNSSKYLNTVVNAMTGNITGDSRAGGIVGLMDTDTPCHTLINYMSGDITGNATAGGIFGYFSGDAYLLDTPISSSNNAMNGFVPYTVTYAASHNVVVTVDTSFGLTFTTDAHSTTTPPSGLLTNTEIPSLPYTPLEGTDSDGNTYDFDFVWANLSGNSSYEDYTHLIQHKGDIHAPFPVNFNVPENNATLYSTYVNANTLTVLQDSLTIALSSGTWKVLTRSVNTLVTIGAVPEAVAYKFTYEGPEAVETTSFSGIGLEDNKHNITNLVPDTQYNLRWYTDTGEGYHLTSETTTSTLVNTAANHSMADFEKNGVFDLTILDDRTLSEISAAMDNLFSTGDVVKMSINNKEAQNASVIKVGETLSVEGIDGVLLPFNDDAAGQEVSVILSDSTTVHVSYDESNNTITVGSDTYGAGDAFTLDGKKATVWAT